MKAKSIESVKAMHSLRAFIFSLRTHFTCNLLLTLTCSNTRWTSVLSGNTRSA
jgi:hypothetical protein